jgi:uncharacterized membrane protein YvbJ
MFCKNCGAEIADNADVCVKCGVKVMKEPETLKSSVSTQSPPKTWLIESILVTLFCCLPLGIVGIVNASKVESRFYAGNVDEANRLSAEAKKWITWGFWIGLVVIIIYIIFYVILGASFIHNAVINNN